MDRVSSIFARFEPDHSSHALSCDVIGHVLPRAFVGGGGGVFTKMRPAVCGAHSRGSPRRARLPSATELRTTPFDAPGAARPAPVAPQQTLLDNPMEASLVRRMNGVAVQTATPLMKPDYSEASAHVLTSSSSSLVHQVAVEVPVRLLASSTETHAPPQPSGGTLPSVKMIQVSAPRAAKVKRKRIRLKTPRRREQCRTNQARYRNKQSEYSRGLKLSVDQLRHELPILEVQHSRLVSSARPSAWYVAAEYFHLFRNGTRRPDQIGCGPEAWLQKSEAEQQLAFLQSFVSSDVLLGEQQGVDTLVEQWRRYTSSFDDLQFQLEQMSKVSEDFIAATASLNVTISEATFQLMFPHLLVDEGSRHYTPPEDKAAMLRTKLLGQRLFLPCHLCFEWDEASKQIMRMETMVDFLPSLLQVLDTIEDAAFVLQRALITQDGAIGA